MSDELDRLLRDSLKSAGDRYERMQSPQRKAEVRQEFLERYQKRRWVFPFAASAAAVGVAAVIALGVYMVVDAPEDAIPTVREGQEFAPAGESEPVVRVPIEGEPVDMGVRDNGAWIVDGASGEVLRMDPSTGEITNRLRLGNSPQALAIGTGSVWVGDPTAAELYEVDKTTDRILAGPIDVGDPAPSMSISVGTSGVWVVIGDELSRVDLDTGAVTVVETAPSPLDAAANLGIVWVLDAEEGLMRLDPETGASLGAPIDVDADTGDVFAGAGAIWVADRQDDTIISIDPQTGRLGVIERIRGTYLDLAFAGEAVWVLSRGQGTNGYLTALDPLTGDPFHEPLELTGNPTQVAAGGDAVWVTLREARSLARVDPVALFQQSSPTSGT